MRTCAYARPLPLIFKETHWLFRPLLAQPSSRWRVTKSFSNSWATRLLSVALDWKARMIAKLFLCLVGLNHLHLFLVHPVGGQSPDDVNIPLAEVADLLDGESAFDLLFLLLLCCCFSVCLGKLYFDCSVPIWQNMSWEDSCSSEGRRTRNSEQLHYKCVLCSFPLTVTCTVLHCRTIINLLFHIHLFVSGWLSTSLSI